MSETLHDPRRFHLRAAAGGEAGRFFAGFRFAHDLATTGGSGRVAVWCDDPDHAVLLTSVTVRRWLPLLDPRLRAEPVPTQPGGFGWTAGRIAAAEPAAAAAEGGAA